MHPDSVEGFGGSLEDLARNVGNMRYDKTAQFIGALADDLFRQARADELRGRKKLAKRLYASARDLYSVREEVLRAWKICKPYM